MFRWWGWGWEFHRQRERQVEEREREGDRRVSHDVRERRTPIEVVA